MCMTNRVQFRKRILALVIYVSIKIERHCHHTYLDSLTLYGAFNRNIIYAQFAVGLESSTSTISHAHNIE